MKNQNEIKYFSMFTGVGGFDLGIARANNNEETQSQSGKKSWADSPNIDREPRTQRRSEYSFSCIGFSEINKYASQLLAQKFPTIRNWGDCTKINPSELPDFDMLCGGFPCQSFSIAGKRRGFEDTRGTMFFEISRILEAKRPKFVFLENVKGLLNHDKGKTFGVILQTMEELGYRTQWMVLNSKFFGVPQNRERVFIIGSLGGTSKPEVLPFRTGDTEVNEKFQTKVCGTVTSRYWKCGNADTYVRECQEITKGVSDAMRVYNIGQINKGISGQVDNPQGIARTLKGVGGGLGAKTGLYAIPCAYRTRTYNGQEGHIEIRNDKIANQLTSVQKDSMILSHSPRTNDPKKGGSGPLVSDEHSFTIDSTPHNVIKGMKIRRLTPVECERLQGFPDNWTAGFSDTQRYKMMGNAVTTNVIKEIIKNWFKENERGTGQKEEKTTP
jgi:DNA (cytosine-5)-methyltransferase 1